MIFSKIIYSFIILVYLYIYFNILSRLRGARLGALAEIGIGYYIRIRSDGEGEGEGKGENSYNYRAYS